MFGLHRFSQASTISWSRVCWRLHSLKAHYEIQPFDEAQWPRLKRLNVIDTDNLTCRAITAIQRPGLRIDSHCIDCTARAAEATLVNRTLLITLYCLVVFCVFLVGCGIYYYRKRDWEGEGGGHKSERIKHDVRRKATSPPLHDFSGSERLRQDFFCVLFTGWSPAFGGSTIWLRCLLSGIKWFETERIVQRLWGEDSICERVAREFWTVHRRHKTGMLCSWWSHERRHEKWSGEVAVYKAVPPLQCKRGFNFAKSISSWERTLHHLMQ